jgi:recombinational DNA repair protein RecT
MAIKTVIRRICKYMPASAEMIHAVQLDDRVAAGETQIDLAPAAVLDALKLEAPEEVGEGEEVNEETGEVTPAPEMKAGDPANYRGHGKEAAPAEKGKLF